MRRFTLCFSLIACLAMVPAVAQEGGFPWHLYEARSLADVIEENSEDFARVKEHNQLVFTKGRPYKAKVVFTGESRPLNDERRGLLAMWMEAYGIDLQYISLFEREYLFKEGAAQHWLPTQKQVAAHFGRELSEGETVEIYVQFVGGKREKDTGRADWLFLVNEFQKMKAGR